ncbi:MAG: M14 family metallopeptidase [Planctomycetes bacterium]|nr:M14 family metallopeptidase [Planctomycetota bacterium]
MKRLASLLLLLLAPATRAAGGAVPELRFDRLYDGAALTEALGALRDAWPEGLRLESLGKSSQGRDLTLAILADPAGPPERDRPAIWIDAAIHGNEVQGTEVCLYTLWYLLENRRRLPEIAALLRRVTFYVLPCVNPDAREHWFAPAGTPEFPRSGLEPLDEDHDGLADEDGPDDLDGDGSITLMRKRVASGGTHRTVRDDPRRMELVTSGQEGEWIILGWEGIDNDGDGEVNEDGPGGYDLNRNFPGDWRPEGFQGGAGAWPLCYPETRAVGDFLFAHPNIAAVQSYHTWGGMILRGPGHADAEPWPEADREVYDELGRAGERILPHYRYLVLAKDLYTAYGSLIAFAYENLGIFAFTNELFADAQYDGRPDSSDRHRFDAEVEFGAHFAAWRPFSHPRYGDIEIGGLRKTIGRVPPLFMLPELCHRNMAFTLKHASELPELSLGPPEVQPIAPGLFRVRAEVVNRRLLPTRSALAARHGIGLPDFFSIEVDGGRVVAGGLLHGPPMRERAEPVAHEPQRLRVERGVSSRGRIRAEWIVAVEGATSPAIRLRYDSQKGGTIAWSASERENR